MCQLVIGAINKIDSYSLYNYLMSKRSKNQPREREESTDA